MIEFCVRWLAWGFDTSLKAVLVALISAAALQLLRLRDSNIRHRVWTGVLAGMLLLPLLTLRMPALRLPLVPAPERFIALATQPIASDATLPTLHDRPFVSSLPSSVRILRHM
jgi:hypothetical protein